MKHAWSSQGLLKLAISARFMSPEQERLWDAFIDAMDPEWLQRLWTLLETEMKEMGSGHKSLKEYRKFREVCAVRRKKFLEEAAKVSRLATSAKALLQEKMLWSAAELDQAFSDEEHAAEFLSTLSLEQLEAMRTSLGAQKDAKTIEKDAYDAMMQLIDELEQDAWDHEQESAEKLRFITESIETTLRLSGLLARLQKIQKETSPSSK